MRVVDQDALARATDDWVAQATMAQLMNLHYYVKDMRDWYGIQVYPLFESRSRVVDQQKYLLFLLKWG